MRLPLSHVSATIARYAGMGCLLMLFAPQGRVQDAFRQANHLLKEWSPAQQAQQESPSDANLKRLREITDSIARQVPDLIKRGSIEYLNSPGIHSASDIRQQISSVLRSGPSDSSQPRVFVFPVAFGHEAAFLVAYNVPYCASCSHAWIGVIGRKTSRFEVLSEQDSPFENKSLQIARLARSEDGNDRFLIYGTNWGDAHSRLTVIAYVVDDGALRQFWARTDLAQGSVKVTDKRIFLTFLTALNPPWSEKTEIYQLELGEEIKLISSSDRPDP